MITVGIIDDNVRTIENISKIIQQDPELSITTTATSGLDFLKYCKSYPTLPKIALVDVNMMKIDGVTLTDFLTDYYPDIKVIGVSTYTSTETVEDMLASGAWGYVNKINLPDLPKAIKSVLSGIVYIDPLIKVSPLERDRL